MAPVISKLLTKVASNKRAFTAIARSAAPASRAAFSTTAVKNARLSVPIRGDLGEFPFSEEDIKLYEETPSGVVNPKFQKELEEIAAKYPGVRTSFIPDHSWRENIDPRTFNEYRHEENFSVWMIPECLPLVIPYALIGFLAAAVLIWKTFGADPEVAPYMLNGGWHPSAYAGQGVHNELDISNTLHWNRLKPFSRAWKESVSYKQTEAARAKWDAILYERWLQEEKPKLEAKLKELEQQ